MYGTFTPIENLKTACEDFYDGKVVGELTGGLEHEKILDPITREEEQSKAVKLI